MMIPPAAAAPMHGVIRSIGRWSLAGLVLNTIIGSGIFVLPGTVSARLGWMGLVAWGVAALLTAAMVFAFAEVASRFQRAGGAYVFAQAAFGRYAGVQIGWVNYFARATAAAAQVNVLADYLGQLWPGAASGPGRVAVNTTFLGALAIANVRGVRSGTRVSDVLAAFKLLPLLLLGLIGTAYALGWGDASLPMLVPADPTVGGWLQLLLLLMFAFGGFESALIPLAEAKDPRRDAPFALLTGLALTAVVYALVQVAVLATLATPGDSRRPLAEAAALLVGPWGAAAVAGLAVVSVYGWLASMILTVPRITQAMAERGDLPAIFGRLHATYRTPWFSVVLFAVLAWCLSMSGGALQNLGLSAVSRLVVYGTVCASLMVFRRREREGGVDPHSWGPAAFRVHAGPLVAAIGVATSVVLASRMNTREAIAIVVLLVAGTAHWLTVRKRSGDPLAGR